MTIKGRRKILQKDVPEDPATIPARNARCSSLSFAGAAGAGILIRPSGPCSFRITCASLRPLMRSAPDRSLR